MYQYYLLLEDDTVVRNMPTRPPMERYDKESKSWVGDWELDEIYTGDVRYRVISEDEAWEKLGVPRK